MQKFTNLTGVQVMEWESVRPLTDAQRQVGRDQAGGGGVEPELDAWAMVAENITCQIIFGYGTPRMSPPPLQPGMKTWDNVQLSGGQATWDDLVTIQDLVQRYKDHQDQLLLLRFYWTGMGANVHFVLQLMEYATARINEVVKGDQGIIAVPNDDPEEQPDSLLNDTDTGKGAWKITVPKTRIPCIAVHLRRGDIGTKCGEADMEKCLIPFTVYTEGVARARTAAASRGLIARLPVVTTDSQDEKDFEEIKALGWHRLDHDKLGTRDLWGSFGPAMVDAAILAHADGFVASTRSTMSRVAAARQKSWFGRMTIYPGVRHDPPALDGTAPITSPRRTRRSDFSEDVRMVY
ncbi:hypothetical protein B0O80DRAFT_482397 [Mortierella sp. GBAus27b]|nr:hypothetical protein B0O80DRAFT_482397 [Mortierella sp. GBAus27b]